MQVFPLEVVRRRMQTMAADSLSRKAGIVVLRQAVMDIWAREKLKGFYAGMLPNTVQVDTRLSHSARRQICILPEDEAQQGHTLMYAGGLKSTYRA